MTWRNGSIRQIARERIEILLRLARQTLSEDPSLSKRYVELARLIGMKSGVRLPRNAKAFICRQCGSLLVPGCNSRVRIRSDTGTTVLITCLECGNKKRYPTVRERLSRRRTV